MKVKVGELADFCKFVDISICHIPEAAIAAENAAFLNGEECYEVPDDTYERMRASALRERKRDSEYQTISLHRVAGMEREAEGDIDAAIDEYAESIKLGLAAENDMLHAFHHSFNRIFVLLDKVKRYAEESDYIQQLLSFNLDSVEREKLTSRLSKVNAKLEKQYRNG